MTLSAFTRFRRIRLVFGLAIVWSGVCLASPALGQINRRRMPPADQPTAVPATLEGTVVSSEKSGEIVISAHVPPRRKPKSCPRTRIGRSPSVRIRQSESPARPSRIT